MAKEPRRDESRKMLGELLYARRDKARISEDEWVALVRAIGTGDQSALHALYRRAHRLTFTLIMRITNDRQTAEELTVDVFHDIWRRASQYDAENGTVLGWIMNQARSRAIDRLRHQQRRKRVRPDLEVPQQESRIDGSDKVVERSQLALRLRNAVAALTADERAAIEASYFAGMSHTEIAADFNLPLGTIKTRIRAGLRKLRMSSEWDRENDL